MQMKLLIVESPSKAKTIEKYLGKDFRVVASVGHVRDLPKSNKAAIDIPGGFIPHYEISKGKENVVKDIKTLAKKADEVILATDPDREGEAIAWHIKEAVGLKNPKRIVFHEITKAAVEEALKHPRSIDMDLKEAQEARRVLDRLVGYDLSGIIWKKVRYGLSAGRVQSPALRIIMEREREIRAFNPVTFWTINALLQDEKKNELNFACSEEPTEKKEVDRIIAAGEKGIWSVTDIKETEVSRAPRAPFITSTLQQTASSRLGFAPSRTMQIAQKLYEAGHITYMRTDSTNLGAEAKTAIESVIGKKFGASYFEAHTFAKKSKNAQEAHEAIRPTHFDAELAGANDEQKKLYRLIWSRTVASQMKDAKVMRTKVVANITEGKIPDFWLNGSRILFDGWTKADPAAQGEDVILPTLKVGDPFKLLAINSEEKQTEPPARYSEAGLIKELEKRGIGRPSTYASIIKTIDERGYVEKIQKALHPTDTGEVVSNFLEDNFAQYISDSFTAEMEDNLDDIAQGKRTYKKTLEDFYGPFTKEVKSKDKLEKATNLGAAPNGEKCPICGSGMVVKLGKGGKFLSCEKFPDCTGARTIEGKELEGPKDTGRLCPKCEKGNLVTREGKFGMFTACARFPKCKYVEKDPEQEKANSTGILCPVCKVGYMAERRGRFGVFYSCQNYPDCKYAIKAKPTGNLCTVCGSLMMEGTKTIPERCSDKLCPNHNPHKLEDAKKSGKK
ncbi:MAG: topoisomerase topoisomerase protein [Parcubacteria group bacterium]|nr:topoisomerase topoisomerase protein [Parcubacteria group bacterium]